MRGSRGAAILRRCGAELGRPEGRCRRAAPGAAACRPVRGLQWPFSLELPWGRPRGACAPGCGRCIFRRRLPSPGVTDAALAGAGLPPRPPLPAYLYLFARQRRHQVL